MAQKLVPRVQASVHVMEGSAHDVIGKAARDYGVAVTTHFGRGVAPPGTSPPVGVGQKTTR